MLIFVVNCGSSSIKYQLFNMADESVLAKGYIERLGSGEAELHHTPTEGEEIQKDAGSADHKKGFQIILETLTDADVGVIDSADKIDGLGHRAVHGGEEISESALVDDNLIDIISRHSKLAPLHNPANLAGIRAAMEALPGKPNVAVFDTAFLASMPPVAYRYAVPKKWYHDYGVRKYGFHGTSHRYVTYRAAELLGKDTDNMNIITAHLGNGCSITAVRGGRAADHSMGMTPLEGLMMGTRSGDIDPAVVFYMMENGMSADDVQKALNKQSGLLGVSGVSNDMRNCLQAVDKGDESARLAVEMFVYKVVKYIGAYRAVLPSLDAVVLTGGIGENSRPVRQRICKALEHLGVEFDQKRNDDTTGGRAGPVTKDGSGFPVWVIPTNEELLIARDTAEIIRCGKTSGV